MAFIDRSALLLLVSKLLQEEIISLIIDINNQFSDMSENNLNSLYCTFEICTVAWRVGGNGRNHSQYPPVYLLSAEMVWLLSSLSTSRPDFYYCVKVAVIWACYPHFSRYMKECTNELFASPSVLVLNYSDHVLYFKEVQTSAPQHSYFM